MIGTISLIGHWMIENGYTFKMPGPAYMHYTSSMDWDGKYEGNIVYTYRDRRWLNGLELIISLEYGDIRFRYYDRSYPSPLMSDAMKHVEDMPSVYDNEFFVKLQQLLDFGPPQPQGNNYVY